MMSDSISRQAAIDAIGEKCDEIFKTKQKGATYPHDDFFQGMAYAEDVVKQLPPANCSEFPNNSDTISRQAAIEALDKRFDKIPMEQTTEILKLRKDLRGLPSIQSEQKRGRWIYGEDEYGIDGYHCDKCGFFVPWDYTHKFINYIEDYNFCPSCGADMRGGR